MEKENKDRVDAITVRKEAMEILGQRKNRMCNEREHANLSKEGRMAAMLRTICERRVRLE